MIMTSSQNKKPRHRRRLQRPMLIVVITLLVALVLISAGAIIWRHSRDNNKSNAPTASPNTKGEASAEQKSGGTAPSSSSGQTTNNDKSNEGSSAPTNANATLTEPSGTFVSNHHPNLGGSPAPSRMQSVCNTTPGATCRIEFTKDGVTKSLPAQITDAGGATYWTWELKDIDLTQGTWHIKAVATLGAQTKTADDALTLEIKP